MGAGTERFKEAGKTYTKVCDLDLFSCYRRISLELKDMGVSFYRGSKREDFIIIYNFTKVFLQCSASTEVAIFFTESEKIKTKVEVASLNYPLAEFVSLKIFECLENEEKDYTKQ